MKNMEPKPIYSILVVDDDKTFANILQRLIQAEGYRVLVTQDPLAAISILAKENIDILISDITMPRISGLELVAAARRDFPHVLRILMTGDGSVDFAMRAINEGEVFRYLLKPFQKEALLTTLQESVVRLQELRAVQLASQETAAQRHLFEELEREHPGISSVSLSDGTYSIQTASLLAKKALLPVELQRLLP